VGLPPFFKVQHTESYDKGENFGQFDLHRHQLNWFRDNFSFTPVFAEDKRQKQRSLNPATFFLSHPPPSNRIQESLSDLA
jgi:hypothetical protein